MKSENDPPPFRRFAIYFMAFTVIAYPIALFINVFQFAEYAIELDGGQYQQIFVPPPHEIIEAGDNLTFLWMAPNAGAESVGWPMEAAGGKLFLPANGLTVYNGQTSRHLWHNDSEPTQLHITENIVYVAVDHVHTLNSYIEALDIQSGTTLWHIGPLRGGKYFSHLNVHDNLVYVRTSAPSTCRLHSADTGKSFFVIDGPSCILPEDIRSELPLSYNPDYFLWSPKTTGIWQFNELVSNEAVSEGIVFGLTENGRLEGRDMESGDVVYSVQFSPDKMHRVSWNGTPYKHKVAVDTANKLVYVWFVDSEQLFAFQFLDE